MSEASSTADQKALRSTNIVAGVAASGRELEGLEGELMRRFGQSFSMIPLDPSDPVPASTLAHIDVLVLEVDPDVASSIARIDQLRRIAPDKKLIAAVREMDMATVRALIRRGMSDVVSLPFDVEELFAAVIDLGSSITETTADLAPVWGIAHSSGGVGASTLVSHLAAALADTSPNTKVCVIDLDFQFGEIASLMGVEPARSFVDCLAAGDRLDFDIVANAITEVRSNLGLLACPNEVTPPEEIDVERLLNLISILRQNYDHVLFDFPVGWSNATLSAACACNSLMIVVDQSISSLARARKTVALLESVDFPSSGIKLVVNRAEKKFFQAVGTKEVEQAIGRPVVASIPLVKSGLHQMQERGVLMTDEEPRSPFSKAVEALADDLVGGFDEARR